MGIPTWVKSHFLWGGGIIVLAIIVYFLSGCGAVVKVSAFDSTIRQPSPKVEVFSNPQNVKRKYEEIGLITASDNGWDKPETHLIECVRKRAKKIGADAIILQSSEQVTKGYMPYYYGMTIQCNERIVRAVAIEYTDKE